MGRVILIRHCASSAQHPEAPLTEAGAAASEVLAKTLAALGPDAVYSSPYRRAVDTVKPFAQAAGLAVSIDTRLKERVLAEPEVADWLDHVRHSFDDEHHRAAGGETLAEVRARALAALNEIAERGHRLPIAASHGNLVASVLRAADPTFGFEEWRALKNPELFELTLSAGRIESVRRLG